MASHFFQEARISPDISADASIEFFRDFGIFYVENSEIGQLVSELDNHMLSNEDLDKYKPILLKDERISKILESKSYLESSALFVQRLASEPGRFFASTTTDSADTNPLLYVCSHGATFEFCQSSHRREWKGLTSPDGVVQIPYSQIRRRRKIDATIIDIPFSLKQGGVVLIHPRLVIQLKTSFIHIYGLGGEHEQISNASQC